MSGLSIRALSEPAARYRVDLRQRTEDSNAYNFETEDQSLAEDVLRARLARRHWAMATKIENIEAALLLSLILEYAKNGRAVPESMASSAHMRELRIKVIGALWQRLEEDGLPFSIVTLSLSESEVPDAKLLQFDPQRSNERLRAALNRSGAVEARGWGCYFLHCEREPTTKTFRFHYHGVVAGDMITVIVDRRAKRTPLAG